jgi:hypothetical protein
MASAPANGPAPCGCGFTLALNFDNIPKSFAARADAEMLALYAHLAHEHQAAMAAYPRGMPVPCSAPNGHPTRPYYCPHVDCTLSFRERTLWNYHKHYQAHLDALQVVELLP